MILAVKERFTTKAVPRTTKDVDPGICCGCEYQEYHDGREFFIVKRLYALIDADKSLFLRTVY